MNDNIKLLCITYYVDYNFDYASDFPYCALEDEKDADAAFDQWVKEVSYILSDHSRTEYEKEALRDVIENRRYRVVSIPTRS